MFLSSKVELIFFIIIALGIMQYGFENKVILKMSKKHVITVANPLIYYLIDKLGYANSQLITKLIILDIKCKVSKEISFTSNSIAKSKKIKPG